MATPFMNLTLPTPTVTPGPLYATENNTAFTTIDSHNHTIGQGLQVPTAGLNINADLPINSFNLSLIRSLRLNNQTAVLSLPADITSLYSVNGNLYYNNASGQQIQLTAGAALNGASLGAIGGDYSTSTASLFYTSIASTFTFWSNTNTPAFIDSGPITVRTNVTNANGVQITAPSGLAANYSITLPAAAPTTPSVVTIDTSGNLGTSTGFVPTGSIMAFAGASAPANWLLCNGSAISRTTYATLFGVIGTNSGAGDGSTTFNLPDYRGVFLRGVDGGAGNDPDTSARTAQFAGGNTGDAVGTVQPSAYQGHAHNITIPTYGFLVSTTAGTNGSLIDRSGVGNATPAAGSAWTTVNQIADANNTQYGNPSATSETRPINAYVNYIIKY